MGWCDDPKSTKYNKLIKIHKKVNFSYEEMFRRDYKYDLLIPIYYNYFRPIKNSGVQYLFISQKITHQQSDA